MRRGMNGLAPRGLRVHILYHLWNTAKAVLIRNMSGTPARSCQLAFRNMTRTHVAIFQRYAKQSPLNREVVRLLAGLGAQQCAAGAVKDHCNTTVMIDITRLKGDRI
jgi:hypothetical protein